MIDTFLVHPDRLGKMLSIAWGAANEASIATGAAPGPAGRVDRHRRAAPGRSGLLEAQHVPGIVAAIADRRNTAGQLLLQMLFDHRLHAPVRGVQLPFPNSRIRRSGHEKMNVAVNQTRYQHAVTEIKIRNAAVDTRRRIAPANAALRYLQQHIFLNPTAATVHHPSGPYGVPPVSFQVSTCPRQDP